MGLDTEIIEFKIAWFQLLNALLDQNLQLAAKIVRESDGLISARGLPDGGLLLSPGDSIELDSEWTRTLNAGQNFQFQKHFKPQKDF